MSTEHPETELHLETFTIEPDDPRRPLLEYIVRTRQFVETCSTTVADSLATAAEKAGVPAEVIGGMVFGIQSVCEGITECMGNDLSAALGKPVREGETAHIMGTEFVTDPE